MKHLMPFEDVEVILPEVSKHKWHLVGTTEDYETFFIYRCSKCNIDIKFATLTDEYFPMALYDGTYPIYCSEILIYTIFTRGAIMYNTRSKRVAEKKKTLLEVCFEQESTLKIFLRNMGVSAE